VVGLARLRRTRRDRFDRGADHRDRRVDLEAHDVLDLESALDADRLAGCDDVVDLAAVAERQQQPTSATSLASKPIDIS
jgi:hypothetical protein